MRSLWLLLIVCVLEIAVAEDDVVNDPLLVQAPLGKLKGSFLETRLGKKIFTYRGVRYAEAPVGQQRFQVSFRYRIVKL